MTTASRIEKPVAESAGTTRPAAAAPEPRIGSKLRYARLRKGYTLRQLADVVSCSESMISKLENDRLTPSIAFLHRLASALDTSIAELFSEADGASEQVHVFPANRRTRIVESPDKTGAWFEKIIPIDRGGLLQANLLSIPPGVKSDGFVEHTGEEFGYVLEGRIEVTVDGRGYALGPGDVIFFPSSLPHGYHNRGEDTVRVLWVNTPPSL